eukprot:CAMPEP_0174275212 /NCGR_PEP_ID=MMETSP0439-20130205/59704_1 /TAXON_ID=0 /ORGANISM="Stereomyxa ramosa, Strain Chinc5" /LENGTH=177 /DNA_ID=CAMNT_0015367297 /DNA_START=46 /DNA_END=579 /DNA_ORIENTATION=-
MDKKTRIQEGIDKLEKSTRMEDLEELLKLCAGERELSAAVFIYDHIRAHNQPSANTFNALMLMHPKNVLDANSILLPSPSSPRRTLSPKRRIHKICKARTNSSNLTDLKEKLDFGSVGAVLASNKEAIQRLNRAQFINWLFHREELPLTRKQARLLVTSLKRRKMVSEVSRKMVVLC